MKPYLHALLFITATCSTLISCAPSQDTRSDALNRRVQDRLALEEELAAERDEQARPQWDKRPRSEIAPGFTIAMSSRDDEELEGSYVVDEKGVLRLPYDVTVKAAGLSLKALEAKVRHAYRPYFLRPDVHLSVEKREHYVVVKGLVKDPGAVLVSADASLDEVFSEAGGLSGGSQRGTGAQFARIKQGRTSYVVNLNNYFAGNAPEYAVPEWQGGETVELIRESGSGLRGKSFVKVLGQVESPGEFPFTAGTDFYHYLIKAGGPTDKADLTKIALVRSGRAANASEEFSLEDDDETPPIKAGDTIMLHAVNPTSLERSSRVLGGFSGILSAIGALFVAAFAL